METAAHSILPNVRLSHHPVELVRCEVKPTKLGTPGTYLHMCDNGTRVLVDAFRKEGGARSSSGIHTRFQDQIE